jgi:putative transcriptional regulator
MKNSSRERRQQSGWSQAHLAELAELARVTRLTVISIEKGRFDPSLPLAFTLASLFDIRIEELLDPDVEDPRG